MNEALTVFFLTVSAIFPIVNPLAGTPLFFTLAEKYSAETRRALSWRVAVNSFFLIVGSYFVGAQVLNFFGVSLPVVQVAGGIVVVSTGWGMLMKEGAYSMAASEDRSDGDALGYAFYPLTLPLTVGPGSISVAITLGANTTFRYGFHLATSAAAVFAMFVVAMTIFICYGSANRLARMAGKSGMSVISRLAAFLLLCVGIQILWNGVSGLVAAARSSRI